MKIAVCFSGQLRTWRKCIESWGGLINPQEGDQIDIFCHAWKSNSIPSPYLGENPHLSDIDIEEKEINDLLDALKPKKFTMQKKIDFGWREGSVIPVGPVINQSYGICVAASLKRDYEIENDFIYDVAVRARYDVRYTNNIYEAYSKIEPNKLATSWVEWNLKRNLWKTYINDYVWMADSISFDIISDLFRNLNTISRENFDVENKHCTPEAILSYYAKSNGINFQMLTHELSAKLVRESEKFIRGANERI